MYRLMAVGLVMLAASDPAAAKGGEAGDVEHARMNALAGGPTNEHDAWLLERYGCYSGTRSASAKAWLTGGTGIERIGDETISEGIQLVPSKASTQKLTDDLQPEPFYSSTIALMLFGLYGRPAYRLTMPRGAVCQSRET